MSVVSQTNWPLHFGIRSLLYGIAPTLCHAAHGNCIMGLTEAARPSFYWPVISSKSEKSFTVCPHTYLCSIFSNASECPYQKNPFTVHLTAVLPDPGKHSGRDHRCVSAAEHPPLRTRLRILPSAGIIRYDPLLPAANGYKKPALSSYGTRYIRSTRSLMRLVKFIALSQGLETIIL